MVPTLALSVWLQHLGVVAAYGLLVVAGIAWARTWKDHSRIRRVEVTIAILGLVLAAVVVWWWLQPERFSLQESLPLQMCDLAALIAPIALLTHARWLRTLLHFWGIGLCSQWVCTPVAQVGPQHVDFWISFVLHASILGCAAWDIFVGGYRPSRDWRDWRFAMITAVIYTALMIPLNTALRANYGYLGDTRPEAPTIVDILGPWPLRIVWIVLLAAAAMTLVQLTWVLLFRLGIELGPRRAGASRAPATEPRADRIS